LRLVPVFVIGPAEEDRWPAGAIDSLRRRFATLVSPPLGVLAGLSAGAGACVGNDSGPTHLAAVVGAPTVALFGPTGREHFAPRGRRVRVVGARPLTELAVEEVLAALENL
jgi:ADP-heptose:LPS heptosyltransferase